MPFVFLIIGVMLLVAGVRNTQSQLFSLVASDFSLGQGFSKSYVAWMAAIFGIGAIGYYKPIRPISDAFLILVIIVLFLSNKGVFSQFTQQLNNVSTSNPLTQFNEQGVSQVSQPSNPSANNQNLGNEMKLLDTMIASGIFE